MIVILVFFELIPVILPISSNYFSALTTGSPASEQEYINCLAINAASFGLLLLLDRKSVV